MRITLREKKLGYIENDMSIYNSAEDPDFRAELCPLSVIVASPLILAIFSWQ
jgi:hypothetical protein